MKLFEKIASEEPRPASDWAADGITGSASPELREALARMLTKDPKKRATQYTI